MGSSFEDVNAGVAGSSFGDEACFPLRRDDTEDVEARGDVGYWERRVAAAKPVIDGCCEACVGGYWAKRPHCIRYLKSGKEEVS